MLILAVDTSLPLLSVALLRDGVTLGAVALEGKGSRNEKLLPAIDWLLTESSIDRRELDLFATTRGPGSFTGVRIGLATMQGMALALSRPIVAMSTHEAVAFSASPEASTLVWDDAGRGEIYYATFAGDEPDAAPRLGTRAELEQAMKSVSRVVSVAEMLQDANVAVRCARRAHELHGQNRLAGYVDTTPIYVRLAEAEVKLNQSRDE
jgi:tRNA threonylcarbamoyl adenosine modification protein YeaZ